jgi:hypothetical protein
VNPKAFWWAVFLTGFAGGLAATVLVLAFLKWA